MKANQLMVLTVLTCLCLHSSGQGNTNPYQNRLIAKYYTTSELEYIQANMPQKFNEIKMYYIHSFSVVQAPCNGCPAIDLSLVDVKEFESQRLPNQRVTITDSERGFTITLISKKELETLFYRGIVVERPKQIEIRKELNSIQPFERNFFFFNQLGKVHYE